jgi:lipopolysaccharide export system protein LptA
VGSGGRPIIIDFQASTANLNGHVVVVQGPESLKGEHLFLDLSTGASRLWDQNSGKFATIAYLS